MRTLLHHRHYMRTVPWSAASQHKEHFVGECLIPWTISPVCPSVQLVSTRNVQTLFVSLSYQHKNLAKFLFHFLFPLSTNKYTRGLLMIDCWFRIMASTAMFVTEVCIVLLDGMLSINLSISNSTPAFTNTLPITIGVTATKPLWPHYSTSDAQKPSILSHRIELFEYFPSLFFNTLINRSKFSAFFLQCAQVRFVYQSMWTRVLHRRVAFFTWCGYWYCTRVCGVVIFCANTNTFSPPSHSYVMLTASTLALGIFNSTYAYKGKLVVFVRLLSVWTWTAVVVLIVASTIIAALSSNLSLTINLF